MRAGWWSHVLWELVPVMRQTRLEWSCAGGCSSSVHDTSSMGQADEVYLTEWPQGCGISSGAHKMAAGRRLPRGNHGLQGDRAPWITRDVAARTHVDSTRTHHKQ